MNIGPLFADPLARQLYAEIASIEQQHVTHYESLLDPEQSLLENWLMHEAMEVVHVLQLPAAGDAIRGSRRSGSGCSSYELGHLNLVAELFKKHERRDPEEIVGSELPEPIPFESQREFVRATLAREVNLRASGPDFVDAEQEPQSSLDYRNYMNSEGSPSETVAADLRVAARHRADPQSRQPVNARETVMQDSTEATEIGRNRTGLQASPQLSKEMNDVVQPVSAETADASPLNEVRMLYIREADPLGSIPPPSTIQGAVEDGGKTSERRAAAGLHRQAGRAARLRARRHTPLRCSHRKVHGARRRIGERFVAGGD